MLTKKPAMARNLRVMADFFCLYIDRLNTTLQS